MIFQHTLDKVLDGSKTQTSRIMKDSYHLWHNAFGVTVSVNHEAGSRRLYYVGQVLTVQPGRGKRGIAKIRITDISVQDVRKFTSDDIAREGFHTMDEFMNVWLAMHRYQYMALVIRFELVKTED